MTKIMYSDFFPEILVSFLESTVFPRAWTHRLNIFSPTLEIDIMHIINILDLLLLIVVGRCIFWFFHTFKNLFFRYSKQRKKDRNLLFTRAAAWTNSTSTFTVYEAIISVNVN